MRHTYSTLTAIAGIGLLTAAALPAAGRHKVLYEKFTNIGCNPCARFAPHSDSLINMRLGDIVAITYHGNYPSDYDPFYTATKDGGVADLIRLYGLTGYPSALLDGTEHPTNINLISDEIDRLLELPQRLELKLSADRGDGTIRIEADVKALSAIEASDLRMFVAILEEDARSSIPASTGQTEFKYEFRTFVHDKDGYPLSDIKQEGSSQKGVFEWTVEGVDDPTQIGVAAWVQDRSTMEVIEAEYIPRPASSERDAVILTHEGYPDGICRPAYRSEGLFRNLGSETIRTCDICVEVNGYRQTIPWEGELGYLETAPYSTPEFIDFLLNEGSQATNRVAVHIDNINGTGATGQTYLSAFRNSVTARQAVQLTLFTDSKPEETTWELFNSSGISLDRSGTLTEARHFYRHTFDLTADDCYTIRFTDTGGDGIAGKAGNGYIRLTQLTSDGKPKTLLEEDFRTGEHTVNFSLVDADATAAISAPASDGTPVITKEGIVLADGADIEITSTSGVRLWSLQAPEGFTPWPGLQPGVYVVTVNTAGSSASYVIRI